MAGYACAPRIFCFCKNSDREHALRSFTHALHSFTRSFRRSVGWRDRASLQAQAYGTGPNRIDYAHTMRETLRPDRWSVSFHLPSSSSACLSVHRVERGGGPESRMISRSTSPARAADGGTCRTGSEGGPGWVISLLIDRYQRTQTEKSGHSEKSLLFSHSCVSSYCSFSTSLICLLTHFFHGTTTKFWPEFTV